MQALTKGFIDEHTCFMPRPVKDEDKRSAWSLFRAQEHVRVGFLLDDSVIVGEAWRYASDGDDSMYRWRIHPDTLELWEQGANEIDWRPVEMIAEDYYAH